MGFEQNDYLSWYIEKLNRSDSSIDLHSSGMRALGVGEFQVPDIYSWKVVERFEQELANWIGHPADEVCFTPGATGGTLLALLTLVGREGELLVESPMYEPMVRQAERLATVTRFRRKIEEGWCLPLAEIEAKLTPKTEAVLITEPSNPSGTFAPRNDILRLADLARQVGAILLVNETYRGFSDAPSFHRERDNIVVVSSLSKLLGTYGFRLGWLSASPETALRLRKAHINMSSPVISGAAVGLGVLNVANGIREEAIELASTGGEIVDQWAMVTEGIGWLRSEGPGFGCVKLPGHVEDDLAFGELLYEKYGVFLVPGTYFEVPGTLRICWLQCGGRLEQALENIGKALSSHR
jgi:aspartate/methionine/tyrosine aminotransferase